MLTIKNRTVAAFGAILATTMSVVGVSPARAESVESVEVHHGDLDLHSAQGRASLHRRIRAAAYTVCGSDSPQFHMAVVACRGNAIADAEARLPAKVTANRLASR
jgi:UrcA family protein